MSATKKVESSVSLQVVRMDHAPVARMVFWMVEYAVEKTEVWSASLSVVETVDRKVNQMDTLLVAGLVVKMAAD